VPYNYPSIADFKTFFARDFPFGTDSEKTILDSDIARAMQDANATFNPALWDDQAGFTNGYMYLSAHNLVMNIRASTQGLNGQFNFLQASKGVGPASESFSIPQRILDNPHLAMLCKTNYGSRYVQLVMPSLCGQVFTAEETTNA